MHLSATGLLGPEIDSMTEALQDVHDRDASCWEEQVIVAGYEERYTHEAETQSW